MIAMLAQTSSSSQGSPLTLLLPLVLMGGVFYFIAIRPQRRRTQQQKMLLSSLEVGDDVMTAGGIFGKVTEIDDDEGTVEVEIAPGTRIKMVKAGISRKLVEDYDTDDEGDDDEPEDSEGAGRRS